MDAPAFFVTIMHLAVSPLVIIGVIGIGELIVVLRFATKRGRTFHKSEHRSVLPFVGMGATVVFVSYLSLRSESNVITTVITLAATSLPILPFALRAAFGGIYEHMIVSSEYICTWDTIERYEIDRDTFRLTHRTKGAAEFRMNPAELATTRREADRILGRPGDETR